MTEDIDLDDVLEEPLENKLGEEYFNIRPFQGIDEYCRVCWQKATAIKRRVHPQKPDRSVWEFRCENSHRWRRVIQHDWTKL